MAQEIQPDATRPAAGLLFDHRFHAGVGAALATAQPGTFWIQVAAEPTVKDSIQLVFQCGWFWLERRPLQHGWVNPASHQLTVVGITQQLTVINHDLAPQYDSSGPAANLPAFPGTVIAQVQIIHG